MIDLDYCILDTGLWKEGSNFNASRASPSTSAGFDSLKRALQTTVDPTYTRCWRRFQSTTTSLSGRRRAGGGWSRSLWSSRYVQVLLRLNHLALLRQSLRFASSKLTSASPDHRRATSRQLRDQVRARQVSTSLPSQARSADGGKVCLLSLRNRTPMFSVFSEREGKPFKHEEIGRAHV